MTSPLQLESGWISTEVDQDGDCPNPDRPPMGRVFMNPETGDFIEVKREAGEPSSDWWLEVLVPDHRRITKWPGIVRGALRRVSRTPGRTR